MPKKYSHEEFVSLVNELYGDEFEVLSKYEGCNKKIKFKHNKCNREFEIRMHSVSKIKCKYCNTRKYTDESIRKILDEKTNNEYIILDKFETMHKNVNIKHLVCEKVFNTDMHHMINNGTRCPYCYGKNLQKNTELFKEEVYNLVGDEYTVLGEYTKSNENIKMRHNCDNCNNFEFEVRPSDFISHGNRCPLCKSSKGEQKISKYLTDNNIEFVIQKTFDDCIYKELLKFDFYLPNLNTIIEFDGIQHFKPIKHFGGEERLKINKERDSIKNEYCKDNNINLLRISYLDYNNIENILNEKLLSSTTIETTDNNLEGSRVEPSGSGFE